MTVSSIHFTFESRYRRFLEPTSVKPLAGDLVELVTAGAAAVRMAAADLALARLFDGQRDAEAVRVAARDQLGLTLSPDRLEGSAAEFAQCGLLAAGRDQPLPVPAQSDAEAQGLGWIGVGHRSMSLLASTGTLPPTTVAGSRHGPAFTGALMGLVSGRRGEANQFSLLLPSAPFLLLGRLLIWPLSSRSTLILFVGLFISLLLAAATRRADWVDHGMQLLRGGNWILPLLLTALLANVMSAAARAAAIARYTPERPLVGLLRQRPLGLPRLFVDTSGAAERARRPDRMRVVGSGLIGLAALVVLAVLGWFLFGQTLPALGRQAVASTAFGLVLLLLRLNPLANQEGYYLIAQQLGHLDLRAQARSALFNFERPWPVATNQLSRRSLRLYAVLVLLFIALALTLSFVFLGDWLTQRFGGLGFLLFAGLLVMAIRAQYLRAGIARSQMGRPRRPPWRPGRRTWVVAGLALGLGLVPYHYQPGGPFVVLPGERADVSALIEGNVREVLVREGEYVDAGQVIVRLDDARARAELAGAEAALARLAADRALLGQGLRAEAIAVAQQQWVTLQRQAALAEADARRLAAAYKGGDATAAQRETAQADARVAAERALLARRSLDLAASPAQREKLAAADAAMEQANADVAFRREQLRHTEIRAPIAGHLVASQLQYARGQVFEQGHPLARIERRERLLAEVSMAEADATRLRLDGAGTVRPLAFGGRAFAATVHRIAPSAEIADGGPPIVRVQLVIDAPDPRLLSGMTGQAKIDAGWQPTALVFTRALLRFLFVRVWTWIP